MHVDSSIAFITLRNTCCRDIPIEDSDQFVGDIEERCIRRQIVYACHLLTLLPFKRDGLRSDAFSFQGYPRDQIGHQIASQRNLGALAVLFVGRLEFGVRMRAIEVQLADSDRRQLVFAQAGQQQHFVNQLPLVSEVFEVGDELRSLSKPLTGKSHRGRQRFEGERGGRPRVALATNFGWSLPQCFTAVLRERAQPGGNQQSQQFLDRERATFAARVGILISARQAAKGIFNQPLIASHAPTLADHAFTGAPVPERVPRLDVAVDDGCGAPLPLGSWFLLLSEPGFELVGVQVGQHSETARRSALKQAGARCLDPTGVLPAVGQVRGIRVDDLRQWRILMARDLALVHRDHSRADQFRPAFQCRQHRSGRLFVPAACRRFNHNPLTIAKLGNVGSRDLRDTIDAISADRHLRCACFAFTVLPPRPALPPLGEEFRALW